MGRKGDRTDSRNGHKYRWDSMNMRGFFKEFGNLSRESRASVSVFSIIFYFFLLLLFFGTPSWTTSLFIVQDGVVCIT